MVRCVRDGACLCSRTWVLVVHNDFMSIEDYQRNGNDKDVENLKRVFHTQRKCQFAELANWKSSDIVGTLSQDEKLIQLFYPNGDFNALQCQPEIFFLVILSHGKTSGEILTDHILDATDPKNLKFDTYKTSDVWDGLASLDVLKPCLKVLFFGPCRGGSIEKKVSSTNKAVADMSLGMLSSKPNRENFVILYATVETTVSNRHEHTGTWFVQEICNEMDNLQEDVDLLVFLMRVQNNVCHRNRLDKIEAGQTPQMHFFSHSKLTFCATPRVLDEPRPCSSVAISEEVVTEETDCLIQIQPASKRWEEIDARACNTANLLSRERSCFYEWSNEKGITFQRGRALIFYDANHKNYAEELLTCFCDLQYKTKLRTIENLIAVIENKRKKRRFSWDGSLVLCVLAKLRESELGLIVEIGEDLIQLGKIVGEFNGKNCPKLIGKPKLFFALDQGIKTDGKSKEKVPKVIAGVKISNASADVCTFVGVGSGAKESTGGLIENLTSALRSPGLKQGSCLQETLAEVIKVSTVDSKDDSIIKPQMISTLTKLVDFPHLKNPYEPPKVVNPACSFTMFGTITFLCYALIMMGIGLASISSPVEPDAQMLVFVNDSCEMKLIPKLNSSKDAFSMNFEHWKNKNRSCSETWFLNNALQEKISIHLADSKVNESLNLFKSSKDPLRTVFLVALLAYQSPGSESLTPLVEFSAALPNKYLRLAAYQSVFSRMESFGDMQSIEILNFHYAVSKEEGKVFSPMLEGSKYSITGVLSKFCDLVSLHPFLVNGYKSRQAKKRFSKFSREVQSFFIPTIVKKCYYLPKGEEKNYLINFATEFIAGNKLKCEFFKYLFLEMKNRNHLDNKFGGQLAEESKTVVQKHDDTKSCDFVVGELQNHINSNCENGFYLKQFDVRDTTSFEINDQSFVTIILSNLIKHRYGGNSINGTGLIEFFWGLSDFKSQCIGTRLLVEEMKKFGRLASFEFLSLITRVKKDKLPNDCFDFSVAPGWMSIVFPNVTQTCNFSQDPNCAESVVLELNSIITDLKMRKAKANQQILVVNFVINSLQNTTSDAEVLENLNLLDRMAEAFLNLTLNEMKKQISTSNKCIDELNLFSTISRVFNHRLYRFYLPLVLQWTEGIDVNHVIYGLERNIDENYCFSIKAIYLELAKRSAVKTLKMMQLFVLVERSTNYKKYTQKSATENSDCLFMQRKLSNFSESSILELEKLYASNPSYSELEEWIKDNLITTSWVLPKFVAKINMSTAEDAEKMLYFFNHVPKEYHLLYCPGLITLLGKMREAGLDSSAVCEAMTTSKNAFWGVLNPMLNMFKFPSFDLIMNIIHSYDVCGKEGHLYCT